MAIFDHIWPFGVDFEAFKKPLEMKGLSSGIPMLHGTNHNTNYFTFNVYAYYLNTYLMFEDQYLEHTKVRLKVKKESPEERKLRYENLLNKHQFSRAQLARYLGCSRAWVTIVLKD